jgi:uncharacterized cupin superfamily protein
VISLGTPLQHRYCLLASQPQLANFDAFLVTFTEKSEVCATFTHSGTEFIYLLLGSLIYRHGAKSFDLGCGDALTFRGDVPHGPELFGALPIVMLSLIVSVDE